MLDEIVPELNDYLGSLPVSGGIDTIGFLEAGEICFMAFPAQRFVTMIEL